LHHHRKALATFQGFVLALSPINIGFFKQSAFVKYPSLPIRVVIFMT
jgi:hypothetical protein